MMVVMQYWREPYQYEHGWDSDVFYNKENEILSSERKCYEDALIKRGVTDIPLDALSVHGLEIACLENFIYVQFLDAVSMEGEEE